MNFIVVNLLLFSQILNTQIIVYPFVILASLYCLFINNYKFNYNLLLSFFFYFVIFCISFISLYLREASIDFIIYSLRFFLGFGILYFFFKITNYEINNKQVILLIIIIFYETISMTIFNSPPVYWHLYIDDISFMMERTRIDIWNGTSFYAALGPALNSSISSLISVIIFFLLIKKKIIKKNLFINYLIFISIFIYTSLSGYIALFVLSILINTGYLTYKTKLSIAFLILLLFFFSSNNFLGFNNLDTIYLIIYEKFQSIFSMDILDFLFGVNLINFTSEMIGGDFIIYSFIQNLGIVLLLLFVLWLFYSCHKKYLIFLLIGLFMSIHYGVIFSLTGQVFFAALMSNKINLER